MRVLVLTNLYPPNAMGGYELSCRDVVDRWRDRGHEVTVLTTAGSISGVVEPDAAGLHVHRELEWYWEDHVFRQPGRRERKALEQRNHERLRTALAQSRPEVVSVWHMGGMSLSLLTALDQLQVPYVCNICDEWPYYAPKVDAWSKAWSGRPHAVRALGARLTGLPTSLPDLDDHPVTMVSAFTRDRLRELTRWRFPDSTVVGSGVDEADFPLAAAVPTKPWTWDLLAVGRVEPRKGFDAAVSALAELPPDATLRLAGVAEPDYGRELADLATRLGVRDRVVMGAVPRSELRSMYLAADAVLFPSRWDEPFGLVPLEAMTQGTPVVATRRGGSAEFLEDGVNCLEVPIDDPVAVATAVRRLSDDPALRAELAQGGLLTARRYSADRLATLLEQLHVAATPSGSR